MSYLKNQPKPRLVRMPEVTPRVGLCKASIYNRMNEGTFPRPVSIGGGRVAWLESDIDEWIEQRLVESAHSSQRGRG